MAETYVVAADYDWGVVWNSLPVLFTAIRITVGLRHAPESWRDYLYWNAELDDT